MSGPQVWPDTHDQAPPRGNRYLSATWLLGRHQHLADLAARVPGVVCLDPDGLYLDLDALAEAINGHHANGRAWADYEHRHPAPHDDRDYDRWVAAGPQPEPAVKAFGVMSSGEKARLRLLAVFSADRIPLSVADLDPLDHAGVRLLADWHQAVQAT